APEVLRELLPATSERGDDPDARDDDLSGCRGHPLHTLAKMTTALLPPNAKELFMAAEIASGPAVVGTQSSRQAGSGASQMIVGGTRPCPSAWQRPEARDRLDRAGGAHEMPDHRLHRAARHAAGALAEHGPECDRLGAVVRWRPRPVGAHVVDVGRRERGRPERRVHRPAGAGTR